MSNFSIVFMTAMFFASFHLLTSLPMWLFAVLSSGVAAYFKQPLVGFVVMCLVVAGVFYFGLLDTPSRDAFSNDTAPWILGTLPPLAVMFFTPWVAWFFLFRSLAKSKQYAPNN